MNPEMRNAALDGAPSPSLFVTTHWSVVLNAKEHDSSKSSEALAELCRAYWRPLYAYVRHRGNTQADAQDLTQEFFHRLLHRNYLAQVDPRKGKFRSFLLVAMNCFLANEWDRIRAVKRGGRVEFIALDADADAEDTLELSVNETPDRVFERQWALAVLERVLARLRNEFTAAGRVTTFEALKEFLSGEEERTPYAELAARLQTTEAALKMTVMRMRRRCGELLREEIANTVASEDQIEEEIRSLFAALSL